MGGKTIPLLFRLLPVLLFILSTKGVVAMWELENEKIDEGKVYLKNFSLLRL